MVLEVKVAMAEAVKVVATQVVETEVEGKEDVPDYCHHLPAVSLCLGLLHSS